MWCSRSRSGASSGEAFNEIGGFFKEFELSASSPPTSATSSACAPTCAARTTICTACACPWRTSASLFLAYVEQTNQLRVTPRFYNTVTVNCTTLVYHMMRHIVGALPLSYRVLLSGYLPEYVYSLGGLDGRYTLAELRAMGRITDRAKQAGDRERFSAQIRAGVPELGV